MTCSYDSGGDYWSVVPGLCRHRLHWSHVALQVYVYSCSLGVKFLWIYTSTAGYRC